MQFSRAVSTQKYLKPGGSRYFCGIKKRPPPERTGSGPAPRLLRPQTSGAFTGGKQRNPRHSAVFAARRKRTVAGISELVTRRGFEPRAHCLKDSPVFYVQGRYFDDLIF